MVGLCGILGEQDHSVDSFVDSLYFHGDEREYIHSGDNLSVAYVDHPQIIEPQPKQVDDDLLWIWGTVVGHERKGKYASKPSEVEQSEYSIELYTKHGLPFIAGLNSDFAGLIHHGNKCKVSFFTDRLGSRPIYYTKADDGTLVFSSLIQSLSSHPHVSVELDPEYLSEFLHSGRSLGIYTPLEGVYQLPPASVVTFDLEGKKIDEWTYWWPNPSPEDRSFPTYVSEFAQTLETVVRERLPSEGRAGLLLSGGVDSRAILAAADGELTGFHMNESMDRNKEEWIARQTAEITGAKFHFLERNADYYPTILNLTRGISNYNGLFTHAHTLGFCDEIQKEVNHLFCGHYGDTIVDGHYLPKSRGMSVSGESAHNFLDNFQQMYTNLKENTSVHSIPKIEEILSNNLNYENDIVEFHGVNYPSWESIVQFGMVYPITNTNSFNFYETNEKIVPTHNVFMDNRIVDLVLKTPKEYRHSRDVVANALNQLNGDVASVETQYQPTPTEYVQSNKYLNHLSSTPLQKLPTDFLKFVGVLDGKVSKQPSQTYLSAGSWPDKDGLIRCHDFVEEQLAKHEPRIRSCPYVDYDAAFESYRRHMRGESRRKELFSLLSLVETDLFEEMYSK